MRWRDTPIGYGWVSIGLHWLTAALVLVMLFVGNSIPSDKGFNLDKLRLHTSLAFVSYTALWFRIWWRFKDGHPGPLARQNRTYFAIGKALHFLLLIALAAMLASGPVMAWTGGYPIQVFSLFTVPSPLPLSPAIFDFSRKIHIAAATTLALGVALHICGSAKHFFIDNDGAIDRMLIAAGTPKKEPRP